MKKVKTWTDGVPFDYNAMEQVKNVASMPFVSPWVAVMPDVHWGMGATVGSVVPTTSAIIPAAVGVDIGCGMRCIRTTLTASDLPESLSLLRSTIELSVPHGRTANGGKGDRGAWGYTSNTNANVWQSVLEKGFEEICEKNPHLRKANTVNHLGTLGGGNHFIEICLDEDQRVWVMIHSGSRGIGNAIGRHFIERAKKDMERHTIHLPDKDLAYLEDGSENFADYVKAVSWAQVFAKENRNIMMRGTLAAMKVILGKEFGVDKEAIDCHHNYISREIHFGGPLWITRKGAVSAQKGELGIIPGSMGAKSFIVRGLGNEDSFHSCSHGAGRVMSRGEAKKKITLEDHADRTAGVECKKDASVLDESPGAYKDINAVMAAQKDLVEIVHTLKQVLCVKG